MASTNGPNPDTNEQDTGFARTRLSVRARFFVLPVWQAIVKKRSVSISGHRTSISVEEEFWVLLNRFAVADARPLAQLIAEVDRNRIKAADPANLSSALRIYVLNRVIAEKGSPAGD